MTRTEYVEKLEDFKRLIDDGTLPYESYPKEIISLIFSELISDAKSIESFPEWIYIDPPESTKEEIETFNKIEEVLGFKLFFWQKFYILCGRYRRTGDTTARILHKLLRDYKCPIDFRHPPHSAREKYERQQLLKIKEKLDAVGIKTREVIV